MLESWLQCQDVPLVLPITAPAAGRREIGCQGPVRGAAPIQVCERTYQYLQYRYRALQYRYEISYSGTATRVHCTTLFRNSYLVQVASSTYMCYSCALVYMRASYVLHGRDCRSAGCGNLRRTAANETAQ